MSLALAVSGAAAGTLNERTRQQIATIDQARAKLTPTQEKISSQLRLAQAEASGTATYPGLPKLRQSVAVTQDRRCEVKLNATVTSALLGAIVAAGGQVRSSYPEHNTVYAQIPLACLELLASRSDVHFIGLPSRAFQNVRPTSKMAGRWQAINALRSTEVDTATNDPEGDVTHGANTVRASYGINGSGIKVGIISDSLDGGDGAYQAALAAGYIPTINVLSGATGGSEEGLAMCEIVHRLAPGATLYFGTGDQTEEEFAETITTMAADGCKIIIDDLAYPDESPFQDAGPVAVAVNQVASQGVLYFSSAGNNYNLDSESDSQTMNSSCWEGDFMSQTSDNALNFNQSGGIVEEYNQVANQTGATNGMTVTLFWAEPSGSATSQYNLYETDVHGNVVQVANDWISATGEPTQALTNVASGDSISVRLASGAARYLHLDISDPLRLLQIGTAGRVRGHNSASNANAFSVAATPAAGADAAGDPHGPYPSLFNKNSSVEGFSNDGLRRIFFNPDGSAITAGNFSSTGGRVLAKPDFTAADGVSTSLPANSGLATFFGTSAAAPHAGAIAALVWSYNPGLTPASVAAALRAGCGQIASPGANNRDAGAGILLAPNAVAMIAVAPVITSGRSAAATTGLAFTYQITAANHAGSFAATGLPAGLSVNTTTGAIGGMATKTGTYVTSISANNGKGTGTATLTLSVVGPVPAITSNLTPAIQQGVSFSYQITATNSPTSYAAAGLPVGLNIDPISGRVSGIPQNNGTWIPIIMAINPAGTGAAMLTLSIKVGAPQITSNLNPPSRQGVAFGYQITATNTPTSYGAAGLPSGLGCSNSTGRISGTPTKAGTFTVAIKATNSAGTGSAALTIVVKPPA